MREELLKEFVEDLSGKRILEFGALDNPTLDRTIFDISFVDYASREDLAKAGESNPRYIFDKLVDVDYVCDNLLLSDVIEDKFDVIIANHVVEHIPNLILWFRELKAIMNDGALVFLSIPDKRYTFDICRNLTTFVDLVKNYDQDKRKPDFYDILNHFFFHKNIKASDVWKKSDDLEFKLNRMRFAPLDALKVADFHSKQHYADVHCNVFTFKSFMKVVNELNEALYIDLCVDKFRDVQRGKNEFHILLK